MLSFARPKDRIHRPRYHPSPLRHRPHCQPRSPRKPSPNPWPRPCSPTTLQPDGTPTPLPPDPRRSRPRPPYRNPPRRRSRSHHPPPLTRTIIPELSIDAIQILFADPKNHPAAITFTSSSTAENTLRPVEIGKTSPSPTRNSARLHRPHAPAKPLQILDIPHKLKHSKPPSLRSPTRLGKV